MSKNVLQDVVKINVQVKKDPARVLLSENQLKRERVVSKALSATESDYLEKGIQKQTSRLALWLVAIGSLIFLFFAFSVFFAKARVIIYPKTEELTLNQSFVASKINEISDLPFEVVIISGEESTVVSTSEQTEFTERAKGRVILYNMHSFDAQKLAIDTRLEGTNGKIYKTEVAVVVPGIEPTQGLPGSAEVPVYALDPGEEYNSEPMDFKILGFKGTSKYNDFYGRSVGKISGGLSGLFYTVSEIDRLAAVTSIENTLKDKLLKQATLQTPEGYILYPQATSFSLDEKNAPIGSKDKEAKVTGSGTLAGLLLKESDLTKVIAKVVLPEENDANLYIQNLKNLSFSFPIKETLFWDTETVDFKLTGPIKIIWRVDPTSVSQELLGQKKDDSAQILSKYKEIGKVDVSVRPFWKKTFPENLNDIEVTINYPNE